MRTNYHQMISGKCKSCGDTGIQYKDGKNGKKYPKARFYKVFEETSVFRGEDELLGTFCKECFKNKAYKI